MLLQQLHYMKFSFIYGFTILILLMSCDDSTKNKTIYFGGHIKNPKDNAVFIYKKDAKIATTQLNHDHNFIFKLDSLDTGLYTFKHGEEYQYIYLEQKDSLLIRLNTWDFDGSLVFSGKGANRNNFLIQLFLENEREDRQFYNYFNLDENAFSHKIDSILILKKLQFKHFKENSVKQNRAFEDLVKVVMYFPIYANKEEYPLHYKKYHHLEKLPKLSKSYYQHREMVKNNTNPFKNYYAYNNYLWNKIYNKSYYQHELETHKDLSVILLNQIVKQVDDEDLKNSMLQQTFINSLFDSNCSEKSKNLTKQLFYNNCTCDIKKEKVTNILSVINNLRNKERLPEFYLKNTKDKIINSKELLKSNLVIYFWPKEVNRIQNMAKRVNYLVKRYPKIRFVGIDGQLNNFNWKAYAKANGLELSNQFQLMEENKDLFYTNDFPRAIILNNKGIIQNNFTFISQKNFEDFLIKLN